FVACSDDNNSGWYYLKKDVTGKKPEDLNKSEWDELDEKALSTIQLCLTNNVF
ncbi:hypothetical protein Golax_020422, partial [Gossypium laxum]|nr:hypothetical protein [Gossypium laxum]